MTKSIRRRLLPTSAILLLAASPNYHFPKIDADEDGAISWEEYAKIGTRAFTHADTDFDGSLTTPDEISQLYIGLQEADMIHLYRQADINDDGYMDEAEFILSSRDRTEALLNSNHGIGSIQIRSRKKTDDPLTQAEQEAKWKAIREQREEETARYKRVIASVSTEFGMCLPEDANNSQALSAYSIHFDCDQDGVVTLKESRRLMKIRFEQKDRDSDGLLTPEEVPHRILFAF